MMNGHSIKAHTAFYNHTEVKIQKEKHYVTKQQESLLSEFTVIKNYNTVFV